jgi:hypothetical protein
VLSQADLDSLILYLRQELDQVERVISVLEQIAGFKRREGQLPEGRTAGERAGNQATGQKWAGHRRRLS